MKKTELQKIHARKARKDFLKRNKEDILDFAGLVAVFGFGVWFWCLLCYVFYGW